MQGKAKQLKKNKKVNSPQDRNSAEGIQSSGYLT